MAAVPVATAMLAALASRILQQRGSPPQAGSGWLRAIYTPGHYLTSLAPVCFEFGTPAFWGILWVTYINLLLKKKKKKPVDFYSLKLRNLTYYYAQKV